MSSIKPLVSPPEGNLLQFELSLKPVSLQARSALKREVQAAIGTAVSGYEYLLSGDVEVGITWYVHERERYQGTWSPDVDNILKPLLDGMTGPKGLLVNDCQVQSVRCSWIDSPSRDHRLQFELRFSPDEWIRKDGLIWVEFRRKLCMPLNTHIPPAHLLKMLGYLDDLFALRDTLDIVGGYELGIYASTVQVPFHRARLRGFDVVPLNNMMKRLEQVVEPARSR